MEQVSKSMMEELNYIREHKLEYQTTPLQLLNDVVEGKYVEILEWCWKQRSLAKAQFKLINHVFGDTPQFEAEKTKKYIVRSKQADDQGEYRYLILDKFYGLTYSTTAYVYNISDVEVEKFNTREEAEKWTNPLTEVIEVEEDE